MGSWLSPSHKPCIQFAAEAGPSEADVEWIVVSRGGGEGALLGICKGAPFWGGTRQKNREMTSNDRF